MLVTPDIVAFLNTLKPSTYSGAADSVLTSFFGDDVEFSANSRSLAGTVRTFNSFTDAANEAGISRIYGGIHFNAANQDGLTTGRAIGNYVVNNFLGVVTSTVQLQVGLANDTAAFGATNTDGITSDATVTGSVDNFSSSNRLRIGFNDTAIASSVDVTDSFNATGQFALSPAQLATVYGKALVDGTYTLHVRLENAQSALLQESIVTFTLDTQAPTVSLITPIANNDNFIYSATARLIGSVSDSGAVVAQYTVNENDPVPLAVNGQGKFDQRIDTNLNEGSNWLDLSISDLAGNASDTSFNVYVQDSSVIGATGSEGWIAQTYPDAYEPLNRQEVLLGEQNSFVVQGGVPFALDPFVFGSQTLSFDIAAQFDRSDTTATTGDRLVVYLVDDNSPTQSLLEQVAAGMPLFTLTESGAEYQAGLVSFNGSRVEVDLSRFRHQSERTGRLVFQLLNGDSDRQTTVKVNHFDLAVNSTGSASPIFPDQVKRVTAGKAMSLNALAPTTDLKLLVSNVRLDTTTKKYTADLQVKNLANGAIARQLAVKFAGLASGITMVSPSGTDAGSPYINFSTAIPPGGLAKDATSDVIQVTFSDPQLLQVVLNPTFLSGGVDRAPQLPTIGTLNVVPGSKIAVPLTNLDPDGDLVTLSIRSSNPLPTGKLEGDRMVFNPNPTEVGTYQFTLVAKSGDKESTQDVTLIVSPDAVTTTRISGVIQNTDQVALAGITLDIGGVQTTTAADGSFQLEFTGALPSDALKILVNNSGGIVYPSIAEPLPLLLGHEVYSNFNNVIDRPIFLPPIDMGNAVTINPNADTTVSTTNIEGASVFVAAGSIKDQQGNPYIGQLSITEVPINFTPAALPENLHPDLVVTIQPGEMVFTTPAPLSLPNRAGYKPGELMDLWSINPITGDFDKVGVAQVSDDGSVIETIEGGIRNSSWHFVAPPPPPPVGPDDPGCGCDCPTTVPCTSDVEVNSGAILESHSLIPYQSLGISRGLTLRYDSLRADPRPIVHFGYTNFSDLYNDRLITAKLSVKQGAFESQVPGFGENRFGLTGGEHFWSITGVGVQNVALQADLSEQKSGRYGYTLQSGLRQVMDGSNGEAFLAGSSQTFKGQILHINTVR